MEKRTWVIVGILIVVLLLGGGFLLMRGSRSNPNETSSPAITNTTEATPSSSTDSETLMMTVEGKEFSYTPSTFSVKPGQKIKVLFKNVGKMEHDFVVEELGVRTKVIESGEEDTVEFVAPATGGKLTYYCSVGSHRANGMEGTITVE